MITAGRPARRLAATVAALTLIAGCSASGGSGASSSPPAPGSSTAAATPSGSTTASAPTRGAATSAAVAGPAAIHQSLTHFRVVDVSFVGNQAWALGSADCLSGSGTCDAIEYSGDGGRTWRSAPAPKAGISATGHACTGTCVGGIRFATARIGYAFGPRSFFVTADGGNTWAASAGDAVALETLNGNALRVRSSAGCPPGCRYRLEFAAVGDNGWRAVGLPGSAGRGDGVLLARTGSRAFLASLGNPAGGADDETSVVWRSTDNGRQWKNLAEPCIQYSGQEYDTRLLSTAPDGTLALLCSPRGNGGNPYVVTSTDAGNDFRAGSRSALGGAAVTALAAGGPSLVLVSSDDTYRSTDGGKHFARLSANAGSSPGRLGFLGFASPTLVHGVSTDHRSIWTSTDAGRTWTRHRFS